VVGEGGVVVVVVLGGSVVVETDGAVLGEPCPIEVTTGRAAVSEVVGLVVPQAPTTTAVATIKSPFQINFTRTRYFL